MLMHTLIRNKTDTDCEYAYVWKLHLSLLPSERINKNTHTYLEEELARIRNCQICDTFSSLACCAVALSDVLIKVSHEATAGTYVNFKLIGADHKSFHEHHRCTVPNKRIALHFAQTETTIPCSAFRRLPCQHDAWAPSSRMHLHSRSKSNTQIQHVIRSVSETAHRREVVWRDQLGCINNSPLSFHSPCQERTVERTQQKGENKRERVFLSLLKRLTLSATMCFNFW